MTPEIIAHAVNSPQRAEEVAGFPIEVDTVMPIPHLALRFLLEPKIIAQHNGILGLLIGLGHNVAEIQALATNGILYDVQHAYLPLTYIPLLSRIIGEKQAIICGTDHRVVSALCHKGPRLPIYSIGKLQHLEEYQKLRPTLQPPAGFSVKASLITPDLIEQLQNEDNIKILTWKFNDLKEAEKLAKMGIRGFITDQPQELQKAFA